MRTILDLGVLGLNVLMMVAVGMELEGRHFRDLARRKGLLLLTVAAQAAALPALGFGLCRAMALPPYLSAGILLVAACPVGNIANFYVLLARANLALSVMLSTLSIILATATMAIAFQAYDHLLGERFVFAVPTRHLVVQVLLMLVLPVLGGMALRRVAPRFVERHGQSVHRTGLAGLAFLLVYVLAAQREQLAAEWQQTAAASVLFMVLALVGGLGFGRLFRLPGGDGLTIGIGFAVRNVAVALAIAITLLIRLEYSVFAVVYFLAEVPLLLGVVAMHRWQATLAGQRAKLSGNAR